MRAATYFTPEAVALAVISIHAAHAGSDQLLQQLNGNIEISIHAAHAGSDQNIILWYVHFK